MLKTVALKEIGFESDVSLEQEASSIFRLGNIKAITLTTLTSTNMVTLNKSNIFFIDNANSFTAK